MPNPALEEIRKTLAGASAEGLRVVAEDLAVQLAEQRAAGRNLVDAHRAALDLLRSGRIAEATEIVAHIVSLSDRALAEQAAIDAAGSLADMPPQGAA